MISEYLHCVKSVQIRIFFWSAFPRIWPEYGEILRIAFRIQSECGKIRTRKNSVLLRIWTLFPQCYFSIKIREALFELELNTKINDDKKRTKAALKNVLKIHKKPTVIQTYLIILIIQIYATLNTWPVLTRPLYTSIVKIYIFVLSSFFISLQFLYFTLTSYSQGFLMTSREIENNEFA